MSSASSSIETPAFKRRTFDWLSTSLLKGMSREVLRAIFCTALAISVYSATDGRETLSTSNPSRNPAQPSHSPSPPHLRKEQHGICVVEFSLFARGIVTEGEDALQT